MIRKALSFTPEDKQILRLAVVTLELLRDRERSLKHLHEALRTARP